MTPLEQLGSIPCWSYIPQFEKVFLTNIFADRAISLDDINYVSQRVTNPTATLVEIQQLLRWTNSYIIHPYQSPHPRIKAKIPILQQFLAAHDSYLKIHQITLFAYGSLIYSDPRNLDFDLQMATFVYKTSLHTQSVIWENQMRYVWGNEDGNLSYCGLDRLQKVANHLKNRDIKYVEKFHSRIWYDLMTDIPIIYSGLPLFDLYQQASYMKLAILQMITETPLLAASMSLTLKSILETRQERRK